MLDILIVEDHVEIATLLNDFLEREGYVVSIADSGEKALKIFEMYGAKLVVLDINLPGMDGFSVCSKIREKANTPILIASERTDKYEVEEMKEGDLVLNSAKQTLTVKDKDVPVTGKEFELLKILIENKGTTMKKEYLFNTIWGSDSESEPQTLNVHINSLRKKIEKDPKNPKHIVTVWGVGYRFE